MATDSYAPSGASVRRISWASVVAGVFILLVVQMMLALLGVALGLFVASPGDSPTATSFGVGAGIYWAITTIIATFIGGWAASYLNGQPGRTEGILHGLITWAVATVILLYIVTSSVSGVISASFGAIGSVFQTLGQSAQSLAGGAMQVMPGQVRQQVQDVLQQGKQQAQNAQNQAQQAGQQAQASAGTSSTVQAVQTILQGLGPNAAPQDRQAAADMIAKQTGVSPDEANRRLEQLNQTYANAKAQAESTARAAADQARAAGAQAALWAFIAMLVGAVVGILGGLTGTANQRTETY